MRKMVKRGMDESENADDEDDGDPTDIPGIADTPGSPEI